MARPAKVGEKKENISVSVTPSQRQHVQRRARLLGFRGASNYLLALHEAEQRLGLVTKANFEGERWFLLSKGDPVPEDITLEKAIQARIDDYAEADPQQSEKPAGIRVNRPGRGKTEKARGEKTGT